VVQPVFVLGVRRSGTTLLRVMLDRHPGLAIPDESYFIPTFAARHRGRLDAAGFCDDVARISTLRDWGVRPADVRERLAAGATVADGIAAVFQAYADARGKRRWGDKTPMYMSRLGLLERLFPAARYVHVVRDGRDAARSFLEMPAGLVTESWAHPRDVAGFACQWRTEVRAAAHLGRRVGPRRYHEVRYEALAAEPEGTLGTVAAFAGLEFDPAMLAYPGTLDLAAKPHQARLAQPPTAGVRDWRSEMPAADVAAFEAVAGDTLAACGYEVADPAPPAAAARARLAWYAARTAAWNAAGTAVARSPLWARRHPRLQ
jgi:Sulfotransferase family